MISDIYSITLSLLNPDLTKLPEPKQQTVEKVQKVAYNNVDVWDTMASWYGIGDGYNGQQAADGSIFNAYAMTAAHASLPFGTKVKVTNRDNGMSVVVTITDRGGFEALGRGIDLSYGAANAIGGVQAGVFPVTLEVVK